MKYCKLFLFLLLTIMDVSTNAQEVTCEGEQLLNVDILMGHPGIVSPYKPGHILVFRCTDVNLKMYGQRTIECLSNGRWDNPYPKCGGAMCPINTAVEDLIMERSPDIEGPVKPGHRLIFSCNREGLKLKGQREITCQSNGEWSSPFPECEEVMCVANLTVNMRSDVTEDRRTGPEVSVRSGHTITLSCVGKGVKLQGHSKITCLSNGQWDVPFPECVGEPTCPLNTAVEDLKMERFPDIEGPIKHGHKLKFSCKREGLKLKGEREISCLPNGKWSSSFPECEAETTDGKCGPPPHVNFADTTEMTKNEYNSGERVEYSCFIKYTLVQRRPYSKYLTCDQGEWRGNIKCLKPCSVSVEEMDKRGIQLRWGGRQKIFSPDGDQITFSCKRGKYSTGIDLIQTCNDGEMTLPLCE